MLQDQEEELIEKQYRAGLLGQRVRPILGRHEHRSLSGHSGYHGHSGNRSQRPSGHAATLLHFEQQSTMANANSPRIGDSIIQRCPIQRGRFPPCETAIAHPCSVIGSLAQNGKDSLSLRICFIEPYSIPVRIRMPNC